MADKVIFAAMKLEKSSWDAGYKAGLAGQSSLPPPGVDGLSYASGFIEGKAARQMKVARLPTSKAPPKSDLPSD